MAYGLRPFFFCLRLDVDDRLFKLYGQRLGPLRGVDLPVLALALVAEHRGLCKVWRESSHGTDWFRIFSGDGRVDVRVRGEDWAKLVPYVLSGVWQTQAVPVPRIAYLDPRQAKEIAALPDTDKALYARILGDLQREFPTDYPTSPL